MSQTNAMINVLNASSQSLNGVASHWSGTGSGHGSTDITLNNLASLACTTPQTTVVRSDHDDYWIWQPQGSTTQYRVQQNMDGSADASIVITDNLLVAVTSSNGIGKTGLPSGKTTSQGA